MKYNLNMSPGNTIVVTEYDFNFNDRVVYRTNTPEIRERGWKLLYGFKLKAWKDK